MQQKRHNSARARLRGASTIALLAGLALPATALAEVTISTDMQKVSPQWTKVGPTSAAQPMSLAIILPSRDAKGLAAFIRHVTTPGDALYRHYLTPQQFAGRFGASELDYKRVADWARAHGLNPGEEYSAHTVLPVSGSVDAVQKAFHVKFQNYKDSKGNALYNASGTPRMPLVIGDKVTSVLGFYNKPAFAGLARRLPAGASPDSGGTGVGGGYAAADIRTAYDVPAAPTGVPGETTAVFEQGGFAKSDLDTYFAANNLKPRPVVDRNVNGYGGGIDDPNVELEAVLDIDMEVGMNPAVKKVIVYEESENDPFSVALVNCFEAMASDDEAQTISVSYGLDEAQQGTAALQAENAALSQNVAEGQTVFVSAGDNGAYGREGFGLNAPDPGSQPLITSVGGTTLFTGPGEEYLDEITWNELASRGFATGGGVSSYWQIPTWQLENGTSVATTNGGSATMRNVPDIAAVGDPFTGVVIYSALNGGWIQIGGTSVSSPIWAGETSVINAISKATGFGQLGFVNPALYTMAETSFGALNDVVDGTNGDAQIYGIPGYNAGYGYDNVSGWGTPSAYLPVDLALLPVVNGGPMPPAAVTGLRGRATSTSITLVWTAGSGASTYVVEGFNLSTFGSTPITFSVKDHATLEGLTANTNYEFEVFGVSTGGVSQPVVIYVTTAAATASN